MYPSSSISERRAIFLLLCLICWSKSIVINRSFLDICSCVVLFVYIWSLFSNYTIAGVGTLRSSNQPPMIASCNYLLLLFFYYFRFKLRRTAVVFARFLIIRVVVFLVCLSVVFFFFSWCGEFLFLLAHNCVSNCLNYFHFYFFLTLKMSLCS